MLRGGQSSRSMGCSKMIDLAQWMSLSMMFTGIQAFLIGSFQCWRGNSMEMTQSQALICFYSSYIIIKYHYIKLILRQNIFLLLMIHKDLEPPLYFAQNHVFDLHFHPKKDLLAAALFSGNIQILRYSPDNVSNIITLQNHKQSCRTLRFNQSGTMLSSSGKDKRLTFIDGQTFKLVKIIKKAHQQPINKVEYVQSNVLASGDDWGTLKLWDIHNKMPIFQFSQQSQTITGIQHIEKYILTTSLDGTLAVYDLRNGTGSKGLYALSDCMQEDLLGLTLIKNNRFVACCSGQGVISLFKWDWFGNSKDRIMGHPLSVDAMVKVDENSLLTGCEDGLVRSVNVYPNKVMGVLGEHEQGQSYAIGSLGISHCGQIVCSSSCDQSLKFYLMKDLGNREIEVGIKQEFFYEL